MIRYLLKTTKSRLAVAKLAYRVITMLRSLCGLTDVCPVSRGGLRWNLDLSEGIDLTIYCLGQFERSTHKVYKAIISPGDTVLDIGANIGAHTLPFAKIVGEFGRVIAFEPTDFAFKKLQDNLAANPALSKQTIIEQLLLIGPDFNAPIDSIYSSWPLGAAGPCHAQHGGRSMPSRNAKPIQLDEYLQNRDIDKINFIKLDVDGFEYEVLSGAARTLQRFHPVILMELAPYLFPDERLFATMVQQLAALGYSIRNLRTQQPLPPDALAIRRSIPPGASINVLLSA